MGNRLTESDLNRIVRKVINESYGPNTLSDKLVQNGIPKSKINLIKSSYENTWVIQVITQKRDIISISYPVLIDEMPSKDKSKVTVTVNGIEKNVSFDMSVPLVCSEYKKGNIPTSIRP